MIAPRLSAHYFLSVAFISLFAPYFPLYLQASGASPGNISALMVVMPFMRLFGPYLWGSWTDRGLPLKRAMNLIALGSLSGMSGIILADGVAHMWLAMVVLAFFWSGALPLLDVLTFHHLGDRPAGYGAIRMWGSAGFVSTVLLMGPLLDRYSTTIFPWACIAILLGLMSISQALPADVVPARRARQPPPCFNAKLLAPGLLALLCGGFLMAAAHGALNVFYSIHLSEHGYGSTTISALWALGAIAEIVALLLMPRLNLRYTTRTLLMVCFVMASVRFTMIGWCAANLALLAVAQMLHALSFAAHHATSVSAVSRHAAGGHSGKAQALYASCYGAGTLAGGLSSGALWSAVGGEWTFSISALMCLGGLFITVRFMRGV